MSACELNFVRAGPDTAPVALLGGSLGTTLSMWEPQVRALESRLSLVAFDHRGHGGSPVPPGPYEIADLGRDVLALLDRLGLERISYCGLSIGGMVGMWLGVNAAERVDRLVLISTSPHMDAAPFLERAATVRAAGTPAVVADAVISRWFTLQWRAEHRELVARFHEMIAATPAEGYAGCCEAVASFDLRGELSSIAAPTLVIAGFEDQSTPPEHGRLIAEAIPGARLEVVAGAAHLASVEQPGTVTSLIAGHLGARERER